MKKLISLLALLLVFALAACGTSYKLWQIQDELRAYNQEYYHYKNAES